MQRYIFFWKHSDWRKGGKSCGSDERIAENAYFLNVTCCMLHVTATFSAYTHIYIGTRRKKIIYCVSHGSSIPGNGTPRLPSRANAVRKKAVGMKRFELYDAERATPVHTCWHTKKHIVGSTLRKRIFF